MNRTMNTNSPTAAASFTRRTFLRVIGVAGAAVVAPVGTLLSKSAPARGRSRWVVSFHMDQPYLDTSGTAIPYYPPRGMRSGAPAEHLSDEAFRRMCCYA